MNQNHDEIRHLEDLADLLDTRFRGPGGFRFGLDGLLGLIPGIGDIITDLMAGYIILQATWLGYPSSVIARMLLNFGLDNLIQSIPFLGVILDFFFKSNIRNIKLMRAYQIDPRRTERRSLIWVLAVTALLFLILAAIIAASLFVAVQLALWIFHQFQASPQWT